eukprot:TRINITY_DN6230_c0_g1_i1.p1 TRINITY_DN6230_c0_g1~~TRINITY_DN6230_c0_g1_i1.p1  ORF type:complete len:394 (+),score=64.21 TRINITY_DN6230_c0_g1_i1:127-1308(+)
MPYAPDAAPIYHVAMACFLFSYISWNELFLRSMLTGAFFFLSIWSILVTDPYVVGFTWNMIFFVINILQIIRIIYRMRRVELTSEEEVIFNAGFQKFAGFTRLEFKELWRTGKDRFCEAGEEIISEGKPCNSVGVLVRGVVAKSIHGRDINVVRRKVNEEWAFIGVYEFLLRENGDGEYATAHLTRRVVESNTLYHEWNVEALHDYLQTNPTVRAKLFTLMTIDITRKLGMIDNQFRTMIEVGEHDTAVPIPADQPLPTWMGLGSLAMITHDEKTPHPPWLHSISSVHQRLTPATAGAADVSDATADVPTEIAPSLPAIAPSSASALLSRRTPLSFYREATTVAPAIAPSAFYSAPVTGIDSEEVVVDVLSAAEEQCDKPAAAVAVSTVQDDC